MVILGICRGQRQSSGACPVSHRYNVWSCLFWVCRQLTQDAGDLSDPNDPRTRTRVISALEDSG